MSKIIVVAARWPVLNPTTPYFTDVPRNNAFFTYIETALCHQVLSGYNCGGPGEPCDAQHRPYFRPYNNATRGQIAKIVSNAMGFNDAPGAPIFADLARMPHLMVAGTTGSGKSVAVNAMILSLLYRHSPDQCRLILIDPKMLELSMYEGIPHLMAPVVTVEQRLPRLG